MVFIPVVVAPGHPRYPREWRQRLAGVAYGVLYCYGIECEVRFALLVQVNERDSAKLNEMTEGDSNGKDGQPNRRGFDDTSDVDGGTNTLPFVEVAHKRVGSMSFPYSIASRAPAEIYLFATSLPHVLFLQYYYSFQGEESKIIIMSLVRSNRNADIGFLRSSNRVNVALSRAQHGMYIIGNAGMLESKRGTMWSESVIPTLREKGAIGTTLELQCARHKDSITVIHKYEEFASLAGDGGCSRACSSRLPCGHACLRR
ncbi:unnamed protein product [Ectocarpus sp. CCAP 1310/34]|nr:unnamed protein product [Ectocarpus sp. CCAP 1310/34]